MNNGHNPALIQLYKEAYGSGDPILCLHGMGGSTFSWRHLIAPFSRHNKLILVDFKGCGKSPKPVDGQYSIHDHADSIYQIIQEENLTNLTLVGNSLGGAVALILAIRLCEHEPGRLSKLILIDSGGDKKFLPSHLKLIRCFLGAPITHWAPAKLAARLTLRFCYYDKRKITREQVEAYSQPLASPGGRYALLQTARQCIPANADELAAKVKTINVATLILWGRQDAVIPLEAGEHLHQAIPHSTLEVIEHCGHIPQEEKAEETISLVSKFLSSGG
jgi:pimeloyl-ACP methyl ester carboxylesterase